MLFVIIIEYHNVLDLQYIRAKIISVKFHSVKTYVYNVHSKL